MRIKSLEEIKYTNLDECYLVIYVIKNNINYKNYNIISSKNLYTFIGLNIFGKRKFIGSYIDDIDNNRFWLDIFESFKSRGINDILFMWDFDNYNLNRCLKICFPNVILIPAIISIIDKFYIYFPDKHSTKIKDEIKSLFVQDNVKDFINAFTFFKEKYNNNIILNDLITKYLSNIEKLYQYDICIRNALFNNYKINILKRKINNIITQFGYIDNVDDLLELIKDDLNYLEHFSSYHKNEWLNILSNFYTLKNKEIGNII